MMIIVYPGCNLHKPWDNNTLIANKKVAKIIFTKVIIMIINVMTMTVTYWQ